MGNKIAKEIVKPKFVPDGNPRNVEEIVLPPEKIQEILHKIKHHKISKLLNESTV